MSPRDRPDRVEETCTGETDGGQGPDVRIVVPMPDAADGRERESELVEPVGNE